MTDEEEFRLDAAERAALDSLPREIPPPPGLEQSVLAALRRRRRKRLRAIAVGSLAAGIVFAVGFAAGSGWLARGARAAGSDRYVLLLREGPSGVRQGEGTEAAIVAEHRSWARAMRRRGKLELGEKLADQGRLLEAGGDTSISPAAGAVSGLFIIRARSPQEALALARSCPNLRHGGAIEIRKIVSTDGKSPGAG
jgi:hypothetical protein